MILVIWEKSHDCKILSIQIAHQTMHFIKNIGIKLVFTCETTRHYHIDQNLANTETTALLGVVVTHIYAFYRYHSSISRHTSCIFEWAHLNWLFRSISEAQIGLARWTNIHERFQELDDSFYVMQKILYYLRAWSCRLSGQRE